MLSHSLIYLTPIELYTTLVLYCSFVCGTLVARYHQVIMSQCLWILNWCHDYYLSYKYWGYCYAEPSNPYDIHAFTWFDLRGCQHRSVHTVDLTHGSINLLRPSDAIGPVYIHYRYGPDIYVWPTMDEQIDHMPYTSEDLSCCFKTEYDSCLIGTTDMSVQIVELAGPKGNFYSDTTQLLTPQMICQYLQIDPDSLWLTTSLGTKLTFHSTQEIQLGNIM